MRKLITIIITFLAVSNLSAQVNTFTVYDEILFYDGYASVDNFIDEPVPDGMFRLRTSLYTTKLTGEQLEFGNSTTMYVIIKASCDNYDRAGHVNLALVPKGSESYDPNIVKRFELARFITPFMDKNKQPDEVPYSFNMDHIKHIVRDETLMSEYDFWLELELFGVPYAANTEIKGCAGRNDTFFGTVYFETDTPVAPIENDNVLIPMFFQSKFNNYQEAGTDELGKTVKTFEFELENNLKDATFFLITSNHGSNSGGEEYSRRMHYAYLDGNEVLSYKPGRDTCEPFRIYNTQANGIYGYSPQTPAQWQSFSNWCPGDVIDNRMILFDKIEKGKHTFKIEVPDALFKGKQGNFPLSLFLLGKDASGTAIVKIDNNESVRIYPNPASDVLHIDGGHNLAKVTLIDMMGRTAYKGIETEINVSNLSGVYNLIIETTDGHTYAKKIIIR